MNDAGRGSPSATPRPTGTCAPEGRRGLAPWPWWSSSVCSTATRSRRSVARRRRTAAGPTQHCGRQGIRTLTPSRAIRRKSDLGHQGPTLVSGVTFLIAARGSEQVRRPSQRLCALRRCCDGRRRVRYSALPASREVVPLSRDRPNASTAHATQSRRVIISRRLPLWRTEPHVARSRPTLVDRRRWIVLLPVVGRQRAGGADAGQQSGGVVAGEQCAGVGDTSNVVPPTRHIPRHHPLASIGVRISRAAR